jgi:outer membrane protein, heavy metal efflux system
MTTRHAGRIATTAVALALLAGCATIEPRAGFEHVRSETEARGLPQVEWIRGADEDERVTAAVREILEREELTVEDAVQVALLNNRNLQAVYADLGVAQADLVGAGLLQNPVFSAGVLFPLNGGEISLGVSQSFLDVFYIGLRTRVAEAQFEVAKKRVTGTVLEHAHRTRVAYYDVQAAQQRLEMREQIVLGTALALEFSERLRDAGNITALALAQERALHEEARLAQAEAEVELITARERLNVLMGVWGPQTTWTIADRLAEVPAEPAPIESVEARAIEASLDLQVARRQLEALGQQLGIVNVTALVPRLQVGVEAERDEGEWFAGPEISIGIPLFDRGQARRAVAREEIGRQQHLYVARAVEVRAVAREAYLRRQLAAQRVAFIRELMLPLRERITHESQLQYNAMQIGVPDLLLARRQQIELGEQYVDELYRYWRADAELQLILDGQRPGGGRR